MNKPTDNRTESVLAEEYQFGKRFFVNSKEISCENKTFLICENAFINIFILFSSVQKFQNL